MTDIPVPPPWHPRIVAATWTVAALFCAASWWAFARTCRTIYRERTANP